MTRALLLLMLLPALLRAQVDTATESADTTGVVPDSVRGMTPAATEVADSSRSAAGNPAWRDFPKDSIATMEYHSIADIVARHPGLQEYGLGNLGQPGWLGGLGMTPFDAVYAVNGNALRNPLNAQSDALLVATEDMELIRVYPQYESFWAGANGSLLAVDLREKEWDAPRPVSRLRHTEAANDYLYTDALFTLNPGDSDNLLLSGTRAAIGVISSNDAARFANTRHERWHLRLRYRRAWDEVFSTRLALAYFDQITLLNGGVLGDIDGNGMITYPVDGASAFSEEAFDPKTATLINPTMFTQQQRYTAELAGTALWSADSSHRSTLRGYWLSDVRRFRDNVKELIQDTLDEPPINITDTWSQLGVALEHVDDLPWARLHLAGELSRYAAEKGGASFEGNGVSAMARARLDLMLGPVRLHGLARYEHMWEQDALGIGAGASMTIVDTWSVWGGFSYAPRVYSRVELAFSGPSVSIEGTRNPDLEATRILEAGLRGRGSWFDVDMRVFQRQRDHRLRIITEPVYDGIIGRYSTTISTEGATNEAVTGISAGVGLRWWRFHLDQRASLLASDEADTETPALGAPERSYSAEFYYQGSLIEGTLQLRTGARMQVNSAYRPLNFHPVLGMFTEARSSGEWSYTDAMRVDLFLFAGIKERATIHVVLHNALDARYISAGFHPMYDRALRLGVDWVFFD